MSSKKQDTLLEAFHGPMDDSLLIGRVGSFVLLCIDFPNMHSNLNKTPFLLVSAREKNILQLF